MSWTRFARTTALLSLLVIASAACGGDPAGTSATPGPSIEETVNPAVTPSTVATSQPDATASPAPTLTPTAEPDDPQQALIDQGKIIFEVSAGGVGCASCHGLDGRGKPELATPPNRGATEDIIWNALQTRPQMTFISLTDQEIKAVAAYLQWLDTRP
jgi:mono/diheme cytochrome c family protein